MCNNAIASATAAVVCARAASAAALAGDKPRRIDVLFGLGTLTKPLPISGDNAEKVEEEEEGRLPGTVRCACVSAAAITPSRRNRSPHKSGLFSNTILAIVKATTITCVSSSCINKEATNSENRTRVSPCCIKLRNASLLKHLIIFSNADKHHCRAAACTTPLYAFNNCGKSNSTIFENKDGCSDNT